MTYDGRHYETGSIRNALRMIGLDVPESTLLGASGGIAFGYFTFAYKGWPPHVALLSRNTFDPFEKILDRIGAIREDRGTTANDRAERLLREAVQDGERPIVWIDMCSFPDPPSDDSCMWMMTPAVIESIDGDLVRVVDSSAVAIEAPMASLVSARAKVKKTRNRMLTIRGLDADRLASGLSEGIAETIRMYTGGHPQGAAHNFGFSGMEHMADMLTSTRNASSWERIFATGPHLAQALLGRLGQPGVLGWTASGGQSFDSRPYAEFLRTAASLLGRPQLEDAAEACERSATMWRELGIAATPDDVPALAEGRAAFLEARRRRFETGRADRELVARVDEIVGKFQISSALAMRIKSDVADRLRAITVVEREMIAAMMPS